jgi:hypothetical protein
MQRIFFTLLFFLFSIVYLQAQSYEDFYTQSLEINKSGMYFLGGWALANMATGTYGWIRYDGEKKYFHQMNAAWNVVNAGIAVYALLDMTGTDISTLSADEMMRKHIRSENLFLINAGLDILYMAGGAWMIHAAGRNEKRHDMLKGYGQSVILQGAFLFLFDLVKFGIQYNHRQNFTEATTNLGLTGNGITLSIVF